MAHDDPTGTGLPVDIAGRGGDLPAGTGRRGPGGFGVDEGLGAGGGGVGGTNFVVALPSVERPPSATDFNLFSTIAAATLATTPAVFGNSVQIPPNNVAVIRSISLLANGLLVTSDILWRLRFNQTAVAGWNALTINPRAAGSVELSFTPEETFIPVPEGSLIDVELTVLDGGTYQVSVQFHGWFYSVSLASIAAAAY